MDIASLSRRGKKDIINIYSSSNQSLTNMARQLEITLRPEHWCQSITSTRPTLVFRWLRFSRTLWNEKHVNPSPSQPLSFSSAACRHRKLRGARTRCRSLSKQAFMREFLKKKRGRSMASPLAGDRQFFKNTWGYAGDCVRLRAWNGLSLRHL